MYCGEEAPQKMAVFIPSGSVSEAWLRSMLSLREQDGEMAHLVVCLQPPVMECPAVTAALDDLLRRHPKAFPIRKVAGTIFPREFYLPDRLGAGARQHLYENHGLARTIEKRTNRKGTYFDRMVCWPGGDGEINQLENKIIYLRKMVAKGTHTCNAFEIALASAPAEDRPEGQDIQIYDPERDRSIYGFPCLSHISISLVKGKLHLTAMYRNQYFLQKAYGNYLGLLRLLAFLAREIGVEAGELLCVATHADDEAGDGPVFKRSVVQQLLSDCGRLLLDTPSTPVETLYVRPALGRDQAAA